MPRTEKIVPHSPSTRKICKFLNMLDDTSGDLVVDYINAHFIDTGLFIEQYDTTHHDIGKNLDFFRIIYRLLLTMNSSMEATCKMFHICDDNSQTMEKRYDITFSWDPRVSWYFPPEIFGEVTVDPETPSDLSHVFGLSERVKRFKSTFVMKLEF